MITGCTARERGRRNGKINFSERLLLEAVYRHACKELAKDETKTAAVKAAAYATLDSIYRRVYGYLGDSIVFFLVLIIMEEKSRMITQAHTKQELAEILKPSIPRWNYGSFMEGPYHVRAEEAILWSKASLEAPLNEDGYKRYMEAFIEFFPEFKKELLGTKQ